MIRVNKNIEDGFAPVVVRCRDSISDMSRIRLNVKQAAEQRGISNPRELHLKSGVTYSVCYRMWYEANQTRLDLPALAGLCDALECGPGELLVLVESGRSAKRKSSELIN